MTTIEKFYDQTGYDLSEFFSRFVNFITNHYDRYLGYYRGNNSLDRDAAIEVEFLSLEKDKIEDIFNLNKGSLSGTVDAVSLYEDFCNVAVKIDTIKNSAKWMRSSYVSDYDKDITVSNILKQGQTLESLSEDLGFITPDNDWTSMAINNTLLEPEYSDEGGNNLKVVFSNNSRINTTSVVDVMIGSNVLGKDIYKEILFEDNDIKVLGNEDTVKQAADILIGLIKGSVPEFPNYGIDSRIVGGNLSSFKYPIIFRNLTDVFRRDDTFKQIEAISSNRQEDNVAVEIKIVSKLNDVLNRGVYING